MPSSVIITPLELSQPSDVAAFLTLMDHYASDPMGGGQGLSAEVLAVLPERLRALPHYYGALAWLEGRAVGLVNGFFGFSTFAAAPLFNVHDLVVLDALRGRGVAHRLLDHVAEMAQQRGCCKVTLEVLSNNRPALALYEKAGFAPYQLDPAAGQALFLQRKL